MAQLELTPEQLARLSGASIFSVHAGLAGNLGTLRVLRRLSDALKVKWEFITNVDLPESQFHRAVVRTGKLGDGSVRRAADRGSVSRSNKQPGERVNGR